VRIARISILQFERQLDGKSWNPAFRWTERRAPLVAIEDEHGAVGVGEAWSGYGGIEPVLDTLCAEICPTLLGLSVSHPSEVIRQRNGAQSTRPQAAAWSGIDMALWDLHARIEGQPLWRVLGGARSQAPAYASGGLYRDAYSLDDLVLEAASYRARSFTTMKMKVAGLTVEEDLDRVAAVRSALGADAGLWVDAVNRLDVDSTQRFWALLAPYAVTGLQSPLPPSAVGDMAQLVAHGVPVIASEAEYQPSKLRRLLECEAVKHLQFCLPLCGGFTGALALDAAAEQCGRRTTPQCFSTSIAQAATLHFAAARGNVVSAEFHCFHDHLSDLYLPGVAEIANGYAALGDAPGLGVRIPSVGRQADGSHITLRCEL